MESMMGDARLARLRVSDDLYDAQTVLSRIGSD